MIQGLFETNLPVKSLKRSIAFYQTLGFELAWQHQEKAFLWIEKEKSGLLLWESEEAVHPSFHPSLRHVAFRISCRDMEDALRWLKERQIVPKKDGHMVPIEPVVRPYQQNASLFFDDPDGNQLELICMIPSTVPPQFPKMYWSEWKHIKKKIKKVKEILETEPKTKGK